MRRFVHQGPEDLQAVNSGAQLAVKEPLFVGQARWTLSTSTIIQVALTIGFIIFVILKYGTEPVLLHIRQIQASSYILALTLLISNQLLSSVRFHLLLRDLRVPQCFAASHRINIMSILGGMVLFNFYGQSLTRSTLLRQTEQSPAIALILTGLERVVSLALLVVLASAGAFWLFGGVRIDLKTGGQSLLFLPNLVIVTLAVLWFGLRRQRRLLRGISFHTLIYPMLRLVVVTLAMLVSMLGAYTVLALTVAPTASISSLVAVSTLVMLAASLPISFGGWGIRELSAAYAFSTVGLVPESGVTMAVVVGILSLVALAVNLILLPLLGRTRVPTSVSSTTEGQRGIPFTKVLCWGAPLAISALVVFQVKLPTNSGFVTVNLADPITIVGGLTLVLIAGTGLWRQTIWQVPGFSPMLAVATGALVIGFLHGWVVFGLTDWALYNRLLGWLVLLCYLLTGALITMAVGRIGLTAISRVYIVACATVVLTELCLRLWGHALGLDFLKWTYAGFYGMIGNPNAFGFQLILAAALGLAGRIFWVGRHGFILQSILLGVVLAGCAYTTSRTTSVALVCVLAVFFMLRRLNLRLLMTAVVAAVGVMVTSMVTSIVIPSGGGSVPSSLLGGIVRQEIQSDRIVSIVGGWDMFKSHPIFGAGLGAFMQKQVAETGTPLVIHSSYLWLLAEIGIFGLLAFLMIPASVLHSIWLKRAYLKDWSALMVVGCLVAFAVMSLAHELVYQRAFWFLAGAALAIPKSMNTGDGPLSKKAVLSRYPIGRANS